MEEEDYMTSGKTVSKVRMHAASIITARVHEKDEDLVVPLQELAVLELDKPLLEQTSIYDLIEPLCRHDWEIVSTLARDLCERWERISAGITDSYPVKDHIDQDPELKLGRHISPSPSIVQSSISTRDFSPAILCELKSHYEKHHQFIKRAHHESLMVNAYLGSFMHLLIWAKDIDEMDPESLALLHGSIEAMYALARKYVDERVQLADNAHDSTISLEIKRRALMIAQDELSSSRKAINEYQQYSKELIDQIHQGRAARKQTLEMVLSQVDQIAAMRNEIKERTTAPQAMIHRAQLDAQNARREAWAIRGQSSKQLLKLRGDMESREATIKSLESNIMELAKKVEKMNESEYCSLKNQVREHRHKALAAQQEAQKLSIEIHNLKTKLDASEKNTEVQKKIKELESKLRDKEVMLQNRNVTIEELKAKQRDLDTSVRSDQDLQAEVNRLRDDVHDLQSNLEKKNNELKQMSDEMKTLMKQVPRQRFPIQEPILVKPVNQGPADIPRIQLLIAREEEKLVKAREKLDQTKQARLDLESKIHQHRQELGNTHAKKPAFRMQRQNGSSKPQGKSFQGQNSELEIETASASSHEYPPSPPSVFKGKFTKPVEQFPALGDQKSNMADAPLRRNENKGTHVTHGSSSRDTENATSSTNYANVARPPPNVVKIVKFGGRRDAQQPK